MHMKGRGVAGGSALPERFTGFSAAGYTFLRGLARNNTREWFSAHRDAYETHARGPMRALVDEMDARLGALAPEFRGDPKKSVFRIHRDVRFSADKSPYKTNVGCWFFHADAGHGVGSEAHGGAGFYFQIQPGATFVGGGIWMPAKPVLDRVRAALVEDQKGFERIVTAPRFRRRFGALSTEAMLTRVPRGYAPDHPAAAWLRYKSFTVGRTLAERDTRTRALLTTLAKDFEVMLPFVRWLNATLGLPARASR